jgi:hypothetical protein
LKHAGKWDELKKKVVTIALLRKKKMEEVAIMCKLVGFLYSSKSVQHTGIAKFADFPLLEN